MMATGVRDVRAALIRGAREEARLEGAGTVEAEHVLLALAALEGTAAARLLAEAGLTRDEVRAALDREWEAALAVAGVRVAVDKLPKATPDPDRKPQIGDSVIRVLKRAMDTASRHGGGRIGAGHILVGVLALERSRATRALDQAGIDRAALRDQAVESVTRGES